MISVHLFSAEWSKLTNGNINYKECSVDKDFAYVGDFMIKSTILEFLSNFYILCMRGAKAKFRVDAPVTRRTPHSAAR